MALSFSISGASCLRTDGMVRACRVIDNILLLWATNCTVELFSIPFTGVNWGWLGGHLPCCRIDWWCLFPQASGVKEVADFVAQLRRVGKGHGVYHWDKDIQERGSEKMAQTA